MHRLLLQMFVGSLSLRMANPWLMVALSDIVASLCQGALNSLAGINSNMYKTRLMNLLVTVMGRNASFHTVLKFGDKARLRNHLQTRLQ